MGKIGGFLEYERKENRKVSPLERIGSFSEFYVVNDKEERRCQAARCMDCGVPFCQSAMSLGGMVVGCPLHNLIPEWNDALYKEQDKHALARLLKTNPFPEFTGRVCPALCEKACINGQYSESEESQSAKKQAFSTPSTQVRSGAVTVHDNERYIIETAYENGWMQPRPPKHRSGKKVAVIGSGPSGLSTAHTLNKRGHQVTVFEREDRIGGLLMYGIPNMKLDKNVIFRRQKLMEEEGIIFKTGVDVGRDVTVANLKKDYDAIVMCCGAKKARALTAKGIDGVKGVRFAVDFLTEVTKNYLEDALDKTVAPSVKNKHVVIVGGGDTGNDCIGTSIRLGAKSVTALEMMPEPPEKRAANNPWPQWPKVKKTDYGHEEAIEKYGEDPRVFETTVKEVKSVKGTIKEIVTVKVKFEKGKLTEVKGSEQTLPCDLLLIAAGFIGAEEYLPKSAKAELGPRGCVMTEEGSFKTSAEGIFTAGDMHRGQSLVVWAIAEGKACAREVDEYLMGYTNL